MIVQGGRLMVSGWIDISVPIKTGMVHWPGDPRVSIKRIQDIKEGDMHRKLGYGNLLCFLVGLILLISNSVHAASFDYRHYKSILNRYLKPDVSIEGIRVTAVDYAALAAEAGKQDSDYRALLRELAPFDPANPRHSWG